MINNCMDNPIGDIAYEMTWTWLKNRKPKERKAESLLIYEPYEGFIPIYDDLVV